MPALGYSVTGWHRCTTPPPTSLSPLSPLSLSPPALYFSLFHPLFTLSSDFPLLSLTLTLFLVLSLIFIISTLSSKSLSPSRSFPRSPPSFQPLRRRSNRPPRGGNALIRAVHAYNTNVRVKELQCWHRHARVYNSVRVSPCATSPFVALRPRPSACSLPARLCTLAVATRIEAPLHDSRITSVTFRALVTWQLLNELLLLLPQTRADAGRVYRARLYARAPFSPEVICLQHGGSPSTPPTRNAAGILADSRGRASGGVNSGYSDISGVTRVSGVDGYSGRYSRIGMFFPIRRGIRLFLGNPKLLHIFLLIHLTPLFYAEKR